MIYDYLVILGQNTVSMEEAGINMLHQQLWPDAAQGVLLQGRALVDDVDRGMERG